MFPHPAHSGELKTFHASDPSDKARLCLRRFFLLLACEDRPVWIGGDILKGAGPRFTCGFILSGDRRQRIDTKTAGGVQP